MYPAGELRCPTTALVVVVFLRNDGSNMFACSRVLLASFGGLQLPLRSSGTINDSLAARSSLRIRPCFAFQAAPAHQAATFFESFDGRQ